MSMNMNGLSEKQHDVLRWLRRQDYRLESLGSPLQRRDLHGFGVPWQDRCGDGGITPVERASDSRALARLERRGLILRQNITRVRQSADEPHRRTTHVQLTPAGRNVAKLSAASSRA